MATAAQERAEPVATRERILFAALDAFAHAGYRGATTRVIACAAGVSEITLFRLFGSKAELFAELVRRIDELLATPTTLPEVPRRPHAELSAWVNDFAGRFERIAPVVRVTVAEHESHPELTDAVATQGRIVSGFCAIALAGMGLRASSRPVRIATGPGGETAGEGWTG